MATKKNKTDQGESIKKTKPKLVVPPVSGTEEKSSGQRSINIGMPVDEKTLNDLKEKARKL